MNVYTDPELLDVEGAIQKLPSLPLLAGPEEGGQGGSEASKSVAPIVAPNGDQTCHFEANPDKSAGDAGASGSTLAVVVSGYAGNKKPPLTGPVSGGHLERVMGALPTTTASATLCSTSRATSATPPDRR